MAHISISSRCRSCAALIVLLSAALTAPIPAAAQAQEFSLCSLFSTEDAAHLVGGAIINSLEDARTDQWQCERAGAQGEAIFHLQRYASADDAIAQVAGGQVVASGGEAIPGLGDTSMLVRSNAGHQSAVLWALKGQWLVVMDLERDSQPDEVAADDLAVLVQGALDNLPTPAPDAAPVVSSASGERTPATTDPCSVLTDDDMRAALAAVSAPGTAFAAGATFPVSHQRITWTEEAPSDAGASTEACRFAWGGNSTLVVLVTREWYDFNAAFGGKPVDGLGGDRAIEVGEVPYVLKGNLAVLAETGGSGGTLRLHREIVKRAAVRL